jgi:hypothetical protein
VGTSKVNKAIKLTALLETLAELIETSFVLSEILRLVALAQNDKFLSHTERTKPSRFGSALPSVPYERWKHS